MDWLNYHHLLYFWTVVRKGSVSKAAEELHLSQPTVSAQVRALETAIGEPLFAKKGRVQALTDVGRVVFQHADDIFGIGRDLIDTLKGRPGRRAVPLTVGVANAVPKLVVYRLIRPALQQPDAMRVVCREDDPEQLMGQLASYALDVIIANAPGARVPAGEGVQPSARPVRHRVLRRGAAGRAAEAALSRARCSTRRCCCRRPTVRCGARSRSGSRRWASGRAWSASSRTRP